MCCVFPHLYCDMNITQQCMTSCNEHQAGLVSWSGVQIKLLAGGLLEWHAFLMQLRSGICLYGSHPQVLIICAGIHASLC